MRATSTDLWEGLFYLYLAIAIAVGALVLGWLFYSMWRFRYRADAPRPSDAPRPGVLPAERGHVLWVYVMAGGIAAIMFGLAFSTISAVDTLENPPEGEPRLHVNVTGFQFGWRFAYTGAGGVPFSKIGELTVPVDANVVANVTSQDVWHNFAIPDYRIRIDAIPGEVTHIWFRPTEVGTGHAVCVHLCGSNHAGMRAALKVVPQAEFDAFVATESAKAYAALRGKAVTVNATLNGGWVVDDVALKAGEAAVFNVTNARAGGAVTVYARDADGALLASVDVPADASVQMWVRPPRAGMVALGAGGEHVALEVR